MPISEYWRLLIFISLGSLVGFLMGNVFIGMSVGLLIYLGRHLLNIKALNLWLAQGKKSAQPPEGSGVWLGIFNQIYQLQKRNKKQKAKLAAALTRFKEAASAMPDAMVILDEAVKIEWFNQAARGLLGLKTPQDIEQHITNLIRYPAFIRYLEQPQKTPDGIEIVSPVFDGMLLQIRVVPYGKGKALLTARDITRVSQLEQVRRDFVANISHELRTPLTVLSGYMETLIEAEKKENEQNRWHEPMIKMYSQTVRMQSIVKDLLLLTRLENFNQPVQGEEVSVASLIEQLLEEARMIGHDKKQALTADYDSTLKIRGRPEDLQSAFSNLVSNAVRYTPIGGRIHIKWYRDVSGAHFSVEDTGVGVSQMDIPRITERFFRVDAARSRETGGTGLGLAIVKHVLNNHDAVLTIQSTLGKGSVFTCNFPSSRIIEPPVANSETERNSA